MRGGGGPQRNVKMMLQRIKLIHESSLINLYSLLDLASQVYVLNCTGDHYCCFTDDGCQPWTDSSDYYSEYLIIHFDYRVKYSKFLFVVEALFDTICVIPNKVPDITKIQMLINIEYLKIQDE